MSTVIKNLQELFNLNGSATILQENIKHLTAPGDNYGSLMLKVDLKIKTLGDVQEINAVAKTPPANEMMQELFNTKITFPKEIYFYRDVIPALQQMKEVRFAPRYLGSRFNLKGTEIIDQNAVLLLENLKVRNFVNLQRTKGVNIDVAKLILEDLANLHATALALKVKKPEVFAEKIRPHLRSHRLTDEFNMSAKEKLFTILENLPETQALIPRLKSISFDDMFQQGPQREPFATISHNDCWVNNTMQIFDKDGNPLENKLVDFQMCDYGSPAKDVLFFIFTSVEIDVIAEQCNALIDFYYEKFKKVLSELDVGGFTREQFDEEIRIEAKETQLAHILLMLFPIYAPEGSVANFEDLKPADIGNVNPTEPHKERIIFVIKEFIGRNWV